MLAGVGGFSNQFIKDNVTNSALFDPCDSMGLVHAVKSLTFSTTPRQEFVEKWKHLAGMRSQITVDLSDLRAEAQWQGETGQEPIKLSFPEYSLFVD